MGDLSNNFSNREFKCRCGCDRYRPQVVAKSLVWALQILRDHFKKPIIVHSGHRCEEYNRTIPGSKKTSQHIVGKAADIHIEGVDPRDIARAASEIKSFKNGGIGCYSWGVHLDIRKQNLGRPVCWATKGMGWSKKNRQNNRRVPNRTPRTKAIAKMALLCWVAISVLGCAPRGLVATQRGFYAAIAPEYIRYVNQDAALQDWERQLRMNTIRAWDRSLRSQEK